MQLIICDSHEKCDSYDVDEDDTCFNLVICHRLYGCIYTGYNYLLTPTIIYQFDDVIFEKGLRHTYRQS